MSGLQLALVLATAVIVLAGAGLAGARLVSLETGRDRAAGLARDVDGMRAELRAIGRDRAAAADAAAAAAARARAGELARRVDALASEDARDPALAPAGEVARVRVREFARAAGTGGDALPGADAALARWRVATGAAEDRTAGDALGRLTVWTTGTLIALTAALALAGALGWMLLDRARRRLVTEMESALGAQASLLRTATAIAGGGELRTVLDGVAGEAARLLGAGRAVVVRFLPGAQGEVVGAAGGEGARGDRPVPLTEGVLAQVRDGRPWALQAAGDHPAGRRAVAAPVAVDGATWGAITCLGRAEGEFGPEDAALLGGYALLAGLAVADDDRRRALEAQASCDGLTGLANHRTFRERLEAEAERARRHGRELALVLIDVDHFREVNSALGHRGGDRLLRDLAGLLLASRRTGDVVARIGGQEFAWLMPECDSWGAWTAAERLRARAARGPLGGLTGRTVSAGVCDLAQADGVADRLFELSSGALYWAKQHGRDLCVRYSPDVVVDLSATERAARLERVRALDAVRLLAQAVDARDPSTQRHSERVAALACELARVLGWDADRVRRLHEAALVHDVGKIGIPDSVLHKDGPLTLEERTRIQAHAALGAQMVTDVLQPEQVAWVRGHHERWDGGGYPDGLAGEAIPDGARILIVADAVDAMTSARPYRPGRPHDAARDEVVALRGAQFPPDVVAALDRIHRSGRLAEVLASTPAGP